MELREGYKQTDLGLIPEDWNLVPFDSIFSFYSTSNYSKAQMSEDNEVGCIHYGLIHAITNTKYDLKHGIKYYVTSEQAKYELVRDGDVIMVDASEDLEGVNKSVEVFGIGNNKYISGLHTYLLRDKKSLLADNFRGIILNSQSVKNQMLQLAVGMKVFGVSKTQLINVKLPLPPLPEQKAIAQVLSDTDHLIQAIEQKLSKKRAIKQGAMQQLLTPKEDWEVKGLGSIAHFYNGKAHEQFIDANGEYTVINSKFISRNGSVFKNSTVNLCPLQKGDITMVMSDIPNGKALAKCFLVPKDDKYTLNQRICAIRADDDVDNIFLALILNRNKYYLSFDSGTGQTNLKKNDVLECPIPLPPTKKEQTEIATILSDMDAEISQLELKLSKYKMLKQGLMQNLLTGKIRLV